MSGYPIRSRGIPVLATLTWTSALNKHDVFHKACLRRLWKSVQPTFLLRSHYKGYPHASQQGRQRTRGRVPRSARNARSPRSIRPPPPTAPALCRITPKMFRASAKHRAGLAGADTVGPPLRHPRPAGHGPEQNRADR